MRFGETNISQKKYTVPEDQLYHKQLVNGRYTLDALKKAGLPDSTASSLADSSDPTAGRVTFTTEKPLKNIFEGKDKCNDLGIRGLSLAIPLDESIFEGPFGGRRTEYTYGCSDPNYRK